MPTPSSALSTLRPDLARSFEEFDLAMDRQGFIGMKVLPVMDVARKTGTFGRIPLEQLLQTRDTLRAPRSGYARKNYTFKPDTYATYEHGAEEPVDDSEAAMYANYLDAEIIAAQRAMDVVLRNQEIRIAAATFDTATWTGASLTTAVTTPWSTFATATPMTDVQNAQQKVWDNCGMWPNALVINRKVMRNLRRSAQITDLLKFNGIVDVRPTRITPAALAQVLDIEFVIVAGSPKNTANDGQSASLSPIWSDSYAMVCKVATTGDIQEPCIGRCFHYAEDGSQIGGTVETYREEQIRSDVVRVRHEVGEKILYKQAGHLLSNIT